MKSRTRLLLALPFFHLISLAGNIVANGDFQTGVLSPWTQYTLSNGDIGCPTFCGITNFDTTGAGATNAAFFDVGKTSGSVTFSGGGISQVITAPSSGLYTFFANIAAANDASGQINGDPGTFSFIIDGVTLSSVSLIGFSTSFEVVRGTLGGSVSLSAGQHNLNIQVTRTAFNGGVATPTQYVDNVSVATASTPEPATFAMAGLSLLGLAFVRYRRVRI